MHTIAIGIHAAAHVGRTQVRWPVSLSSFSVMGFSLFLKKFVDDEEAVSQHVKHR